MYYRQHVLVQTNMFIAMKQLLVAFQIVLRREVRTYFTHLFLCGTEVGCAFLWNAEAT